MIQLTRSGVRVAGTDDDLRRARALFDSVHCIQLRGLLAPDILVRLRRELDRARFAPRVHGHIGVELAMTHNAGLDLLHFLINDPIFFRIIRQITGCAPIGSFGGRIYRMVPGSGHYDSWHSDAVDHRMVGMSVNLSAQPYCGGTFQLRERASEAMLVEAPNTGFGDAIVFRIDERLQHQVTAVEGTVPKTAFAGWFVSEPVFLARLSHASASTVEPNVSN